MKHASLFVIGALLIAVAPAVSYADLSNMDIGGDIRTLFVATENAVDLNDEYDDDDNFFRLESHLWFEAAMSDNVKAKISFEVDRDWEGTADVEGTESGSNSLFNGDSDLNVFLEEAWLQAEYLYTKELSLKIGRQFLEYGDGFIIGDSQPNTPQNLKNLGDWEKDPFDAAVLSWDADGIVADLVYAKAVEEHDADADADLVGINIDYSRMEPHVFSVYYWLLHAEDDNYVRYFKVNEAWTETLHVIGGRAVGAVPMLEDQNLSYVVELAYQFGDAEEVVEFPAGNDVRSDDIGAFAAHAGLAWRPEMDVAPIVGFDYFFLSGADDSDDDENEWRQVFENHTYGEIAENWVATNMHVFSFCLGADNLMNGKLQALLKYYYFLMDEEEGDVSGPASLATAAGPHSGYGEYDKAASTPSSGYAYPYRSFSNGYLQTTGDDNDFGHEIDLFLTYNISESLVAKVAGGVFIPGDAIETWNSDSSEGGSWDDADEAFFVRGEVAVKF